MNLKTFAKAARRSVSRNASKILGGLAITGRHHGRLFCSDGHPEGHDPAG